MGSVIRAIQELGVEVIHIPDGCTGLLQPLNVGLNKPFKVRVRAIWEEWMMAMIDNHGIVESPTRDDIASWAASAHWDMVDEMHVSGVLMDDHDEDEHHEMWTMKVNKCINNYVLKYHHSNYYISNTIY